jgi:hypothetical protein
MLISSCEKTKELKNIQKRKNKKYFPDFLNPSGFENTFSHLAEKPVSGPSFRQQHLKPAGC